MNELESIITHTENWANLLAKPYSTPFARHDVDRESIRYKVIEHTKTDDVLNDLVNECEYLTSHKAAEATLFILPNAFQSIDEFQELVRLTKTRLKKQGLAQVYKLAIFHRHHRPRVCKNDDPQRKPDNDTNHPPYPCLYIIKESRMEYRFENQEIEIEEKYRPEATITNIDNYQQVNSLLFYIALAVVLILSIYTYAQVTNYSLPRTNTTITEIKNSTDLYNKLSCRPNVSGTTNQRKCKNVMLQRSMRKLTFEYSTDEKTHSFSSTFYGNTHKNSVLGDSIPINFYQNKRNLLIPSTSRIVFILSVLFLGIAALFRWLLLSYRANRVTENQPDIDLKSRFEQRWNSNFFARLTGMLCFTIYLFTFLFDANTILKLTITTLFPIIIARGYFHLTVRFSAEFTSEIKKNALQVGAVTALVTVCITMFTGLVEIYSVDTTIVPIILSAVYFISLFEVKRLAVQ